jgi:hypothetical protein
MMIISEEKDLSKEGAKTSLYTFLKTCRLYVSK